ncbi:thioesterase family protein [Aliiglaciecola sp. 3_MG-2023]|uniref:thioesterase family protein n=1 Tax=Aliiglaciecola sp. 3_MG-2023 TaxID=3062644 RepID=UPI0026E1E1C0|nr:thioesterase family protein [Aliiglaciecola sp. 3_MG-2023]MDO6695473.1 thioesterase family protein [Aliiglaciecola sp. 3_MG-2023]
MMLNNIDKTKRLSTEALAEFVMYLFSEQMPFNKLLGIKIDKLGVDEVEVRLPWSDKLMGNPIHKILHGGVTAAILDTVGGVMAVLYSIKDFEEISVQEFQNSFSNLGTIDMRVDYLRPGKGEEFIATAKVIRKGKKVAVCRMELHNETGTHIAFGTATYMVG